MYSEAEVLPYFCFLSAYGKCMGRHQKRKRSAKSVAKEYFPVGELAKRRKASRSEYLASCNVLQLEQRKLNKVSAKVDQTLA